MSGMKNAPALILAALAALVITSASTPIYPTPTITVQDSGSFSEQVVILPTTQTVTAGSVVYTVFVGDVGPGDTFLVQSEFEVTNDLGYNIMIGSYIVLADGPTATTGTDITEPNAFNVTPDMHHGVPVKVGSLAVTESLSNQYVNVVAYSRASRATATSSIRVEPDYGRLIVTTIRNG